MTYKQLNKDQREVIQILINKKENFTTIGNSIKVDRTTISKEIKRNRYIKSNYYDTFDFKGTIEFSISSITSGVISIPLRE